MDFMQKAMTSTVSGIDSSSATMLDSMADEELDIVDRTDYIDGDDNLIDMLEVMHPSNITRH